MRLLPGIIVGCFLTIAGAYFYDSMNTSRVAGGDVASASRTLVNWGVASSDWNLLKAKTQQKWAELSAK
jgi:hypothetical protein